MCNIKKLDKNDYEIYHSKPISFLKLINYYYPLKSVSLKKDAVEYHVLLVVFLIQSLIATQAYSQLDNNNEQKEVWNNFQTKTDEWCDKVLQSLDPLKNKLAVTGIYTTKAIIKQ